MAMILVYLLLGVAAGVISGLVGIGGGVIIVPALTLLFGFTQHKAQGTTLAMLVPPIGLLAAWTYFKNDYVDIKVAILIALGFILGGFLGAKLAVVMSEAILKKVFGTALLVLALRMLIWG